jgi:hypothetical protein
VFTSPPVIVALPFQSNPLLFWIRGASILAHGVVKRDRLAESAKCFKIETGGLPLAWAFLALGM